MNINPSISSQSVDPTRVMRITAINSLDQLVMMLVDAMLVWGVSASFAYWFVLLFRLPAWYWYPLLIVILWAMVFFCRKLFSWPSRGRVNGLAITLLLVCIVSASVNVFTNRPDSDDIAFSHRAVVAATNLSIPIAMGDTAHDVLDLPPITPLHIFTTIEVTTALVAQALNVNQVMALHMGLGSLVNFMLPAIYFLFLRFFRIRSVHAVLGAVGILIFLIMSGNVHRDWGNFTIMRSWQGKVILMEIIVPLALLFSLRFHIYGRRSDIFRLHAVTVCGIVWYWAVFSAFCHRSISRCRLVGDNVFPSFFISTWHIIQYSNSSIICINAVMAWSFTEHW